MPGDGDDEIGRPPLGGCDSLFPPGEEVSPPPPAASAAADASTRLAFRSVPDCAQVDDGAGANVDTVAKGLDGGLPPTLPLFSLETLTGGDGSAVVAAATAVELPRDCGVSLWWRRRSLAMCFCTQRHGTKYGMARAYAHAEKVEVDDQPLHLR